MSMLRFRNIVFDLDGTIVDSYPGIAESLRQAISFVDSSLPMPDFRRFIGPPLPLMLTRMWPKLGKDALELLIQEFRKDYNDRGCLFAELYPEVPEILRKLKADGVDLFILTNKPEAPTLKILHHFKLSHYFQDIFSPDSIKPQVTSKSAMAILLVQRHQLVAGSTLLVGDSQDDLDASEVAGFSFIEASYGYGSFDKNVTQIDRLRLKRPSDLATLLDSPFQS